jgi:hypothetical protein
VTAGRRVLLLVPARSYRAADFMLAAAKMGLDLTVASDGALPVGRRPVIPVHRGDPDHATVQIISASVPVDAVIAADAPMLLLAATVAARLGLPHNPASAVLAASDKARQRQLWAAAAYPAVHATDTSSSHSQVRTVSSLRNYPAPPRPASPHSPSTSSARPGGYPQAEQYTSR